MDLQGLPLFLAIFENFENLIFPLFSGLRGERGSADFMSILVNTRGCDILFKQGSPIGSLGLQRIKLIHFQR